MRARHLADQSLGQNGLGEIKIWTDLNKGPASLVAKICVFPGGYVHFDDGFMG